MQSAEHHSLNSEHGEGERERAGAGAGVGRGQGEPAGPHQGAGRFFLGPPEKSGITFVIFKAVLQWLKPELVNPGQT